MPYSMDSRRQRVTLPYSEAAMHARIAGQQAVLVEEDRYINWEVIPEGERYGCVAFVYEADGVTVRSQTPLLKAEAGWEA